MKPKTPTALAAQEDVERLRVELLKLVRLSGVSHQELDGRNGWNRGYASQALQGSMNLTLRHVFGILAVLEIPVERFFQHLARRREPGRSNAGP